MQNYCCWWDHFFDTQRPCRHLAIHCFLCVLHMGSHSCCRSVRVKNMLESGWYDHFGYDLSLWIGNQRRGIFQFFLEGESWAPIDNLVSAQPEAAVPFFTHRCVYFYRPGDALAYSWRRSICVNNLALLQPMAGSQDPNLQFNLVW